MSIAPSTLRLSKALYWISTGLIVALPVVLLVAVARVAVEPEALRTAFPNVPIERDLDATLATLVGLVGLFPVAALIYTLVEMRGLFARYGRGEILTHACAAHIQGIGQGLFAVAALGVIMRSLQIAILTWRNPEGQRVLAIGLDQNQLGFLFAGALMILIGRVMREAARVAEENKAFI